MVTITKLALFWDPIGLIKEAINEWSPENCESEKDFEISLYDFLNAHSKNVRIQKQYGIGRARADIIIGNKVLIEVKKDLKEKSAFDRLRGQLEDYLSWKGETIILLIGETDPDFKRYLESRANQDIFSWTPGFHIVEKVIRAL